jgi:6-phosphogluconolactonase
MNPILHIFDTPNETARAVAELILCKSKEKNKQSLPFNMAISGGNTPKLLFKILAEKYTDSIPWNLVRLFWVDERCVPPTHAESNFGMTYENLLKQVPIYDSNIFRMQGELDPETEALRYQKLLENELPMRSGFPQFDLILLGMGDDGHTASIFPDNMDLLYSDLAVSVSTHPTSGQKRITLTGQTINQANQVIFLITGESKKGILHQIFKHKPQSENYPASYVHSNNGNIEFYLDKSAASEP